MIRSSMNIKARVTRARLLDALRANREQHATLVAEARKGYVERAREALATKLELLEQGKIVNLQFNLAVPLDYTAEYDTAIKMMEWTTEDEIDLTAEEFKSLVLDEWDWIHTLVATNAAYSQSTRAYGMSKGVL